MRGLEDRTPDNIYMPNPTDYLLQLVRDALSDLDKTAGVSAAIRKAIRVARMRGDTDNLYWLEQEMIPFENVKMGHQRLVDEIAPSYTRESFMELKSRTLRTYLQTRSLPRKGGEEPMIHGASVVGIEETMASAEKWLAKPRNVWGDDAARADVLEGLADLKSVYERIAHRLHIYLSQTETELLHRRYTANVFERNRRYVEERLRTIAPDALEQIMSAAERLQEGGNEAFSHALTSCRRCLKSLADRIYPVPEAPVVGADGKPRTLTDSMFVARLWQFTFERMRGSTSRDILLNQVHQLGERIDRLNSLSSKGVHAAVDEIEATQCVLETYSVVGNLLRLSEGSSAATNSP